MPTTATNIINYALDRLGVAIITTLGTDATPQDNFMNRNYVNIWKEVMRLAGVNSTRTRAQLKYTTMALTLSSGAVAAGVTATAASAFFSERDVAAELHEVGTSTTGRATITAYTSSTVVTVENTTAWVDSTPAKNTWRLKPVGVGYNYAYELPSGFVKAISVDQSEYQYEIEGNRLLTNYADAVLQFDYYESDPDVWDHSLREAIIAKLAFEAAWPLTKDPNAVKLMAGQWEIKLAEAKGAANSEIQPKGRISATTLLDCRRGSTTIGPYSDT